ncbi:hypothetical protein GQ44DRAFT_501154 [Phaeosphaeriaceae sp. PMI808]|nr:hypothetical protein GQ44DRAFT_501154 [Phaeosphaeriaceae sp. PMI808]
MAHQVNTKAKDCVNSKSKRSADQEHVKTSRKRQKITLASPQEDKSSETQRQDQIFRFMDLPGELRNQVYEHAINQTYRYFPPISPNSRPRPRRGRSKGAPEAVLSTDDQLLPIPFLSLAQTCSQLRSEFRPAWLSTHKIPMYTLDRYLKAFFPAPDPRASLEAQRRMATQYSDSGSLRLWIRMSELSDTDIMGLLRHVTRFPKLTITCEAHPHTMPVQWLGALQGIIRNKNDVWVKAIVQKHISQVRVKMVNNAGRPVRIVMKERYAPQWMRPLIAPDSLIPEGYVASLGLGEVAMEWRVSFGVDYS